MGHALVQLLDIIPRGDCQEGSLYCTYRNTNPKYIKLHENLRRLTEIKVRLANEEGESLSFGSSGETRLSLHFLAKSVLHHGS